MSILNTVKEFLSGKRPSNELIDSPQLAVVELPQPGLPADDWETTTGRLRYPQQERRVTYHNSEISGTCTGKIGELTGSVMVGLFEDLPLWLPSLLIQVRVQTDAGELTASLRDCTGEIVSVSAPGTFEGNAELVSGRVWLRCEAGPTPARNVRYEVVII